LVESEENGKKHFSICESKHLLRSITNEKWTIIKNKKFKISKTL
jgi:hypothetical protein